MVSDLTPVGHGHFHNFDLRQTRVERRVEKRYGWQFQFTASVEFRRPPRAYGWAECDGLEFVEKRIRAEVGELVGGDITDARGDLDALANRSHVFSAWGVQGMRVGNNNTIRLSVAFFVPSDAPKKIPANPDEALYRLLKKHRDETVRLMRAAFSRGFEKALADTEELRAREERARQANAAAGWVIHEAVQRAKVLPLLPTDSVPKPYEQWEALLKGILAAGIDTCLRGALDAANIEAENEAERAAIATAWWKLTEIAPKSEALPANPDLAPTIGFVRVKAALWNRWPFHGSDESQPLFTAADFVEVGTVEEDDTHTEAACVVGGCLGCSREESR